MGKTAVLVEKVEEAAKTLVQAEIGREVDEHIVRFWLKSGPLSGRNGAQSAHGYINVVPHGNGQIRLVIIRNGRTSRLPERETGVRELGQVSERYAAKEAGRLLQEFSQKAFTP